MKNATLRRALVALSLSIPIVTGAQLPGEVAPAAYDKEMRSLLATAGRLNRAPSPLAITPPSTDWQLGMISWAAMDRQGLVYLLHRGKAADPVVVIDSTGQVVRSWGAGRYTMPHAIRVDPEGNIWTTDARTSVVTKYTPAGQVLLEISVGGVPEGCGTPAAPNPFCGVTDVAFGRNGRIFIADGYRNARVLEYSADGVKVREWSTATPGTATFARAHSIAVGDDGTIFVADRENARIQRFSNDGKLLGEWTRFGRPFALTFSSNSLWAATVPVVEPWTLSNLIRIDPVSGRPLEHAAIPGVHGMYAGPETVVITPGVDGRPLVFRKGP